MDSVMINFGVGRPEGGRSLVLIVGFGRTRFLGVLRDCNERGIVSSLSFACFNFLNLRYNVVAVIAAVAPNARLRMGTIVGARFARYCCMKGLLRYSLRSQLERKRTRIDCDSIMIHALRGISHHSRRFTLSLSSSFVIRLGDYSIPQSRCLVAMDFWRL